MESVKKNDEEDEKTILDFTKGSIKIRDFQYNTLS